MSKAQPRVANHQPFADEKFPLQVPSYRFNQRHDMFKRRTWDQAFIPAGEQLYKQVKYQDKYGYRKLDYALRNAAWNIEYDFACGNMRGNSGLYSWTRIADKSQRFVATGGPVVMAADQNTRVVKKAAAFLGADLVGICPVHPNLVYSHEFDLLEMKERPLELPANCTYAIVMAIEMDYAASLHSPDSISGAATGLGYSRQAIVANQVAAFIRGLGFIAVPSGNDTALSIPLAIAAGLGELGRNGLLITAQYGPRVRICKVFTDLPLQIDRVKSFGVEAFCQACKKCASRCPSQAIPYGAKTTAGESASNFSGIEKWYINPEKCFMFWVKNYMDCNNCIHVCPFNKPKGRSHDVVRFLIRHFSFLNRFLVAADSFFGYGKAQSARQKVFWESR